MEDYKELFLNEAKEHLDGLNSLLVTLEKDTKDTETINSIFRIFHTLKGNSATMGYDAFSKLAHRLEDLLDLIRNKKLKVTKEIMDILFEGCDTLEDGLSKIQGNVAESLNPFSLIEKIDKINPKNEEKSSQSQESEIQDKVEFSKKEEQLIKKSGLDKKDIRRAVIDFEDGPLKAPKALAIIKKIEANKDNTLIRINPEKDGLEKELKNKLEIIFGTRNVAEVDGIIKQVSKIKNYRIFSIDESYDDHAKEVNKNNIIATHKEELKKVQEVKIDIKRLDSLMDMVGELLIHKMRLENINKGIKSKELEEITNAISLLTQNIQSEVIEERMIPLGSVFSRLPRVVRDLSNEEGKEIDFIMEGDDKTLDRTVIDKITDPLIHMIRNSVDHGIELPEDRLKAKKDRKGTIRLSASREKNSVVIEIEDDGAGIDPQKIREVAIRKGALSAQEANALSDEKAQELVFNPGFSTSEKVTEVSGRGVGMDVVSTNVKQVGGKVFLSSKKGAGTKVKIDLPLTVAIISVLIVRVKNERYAISLNNVSEILDLPKNDIKTIQKNETFILRGESIPLLRLKKLIGFEAGEGDKLTVIIVENGKRKIGIAVDSIDSQQQILIKNIDDKIKKIKGIAGGTILGDGKVCFILDIDSLIDIEK